jgi:cytochrome b561
MYKNTPQSFGSVSKLFHWLISALVILILIAGYFMTGISDDALKATVINLHKLTGLTILALMVLRLGWTLVNPKPLPPPGTSGFMKLVEWGVHFFLYAIILAMPLAGWVGSVAAGHAPHAGSLMFNLAFITPVPNKPLAESAFLVHYILAIVIIVTVSLHVLAALYHHVIRKDNVLRRMMP